MKKIIDLPAGSVTMGTKLNDNVEYIKMKMNINMDCFPKIDKDKFLASSPTLIANSMLIDFYEDPIHGDEAGLIAVFGNQCRVTDLYDIPDQQEIIEWFVDTEDE